MRIDKFLAHQGLGSRREVHQLLRQGRITRQGQVIRSQGLDLAPEDLATVCLDGNPLIEKQLAMPSSPILLHKPASYLTALEDSKQATIADLLPSHWFTQGLRPVGRLDKDTTGLLLLTCDGQLNHRLCQPKWHIPKSYLVNVEGLPFCQEDIQAVAKGLVGRSMHFAPGLLEIHSDYQATLTITEGQFHQVKHMMMLLDKRVIRLHRYKIGPLGLDGLEEGSYRVLKPEESQSLYTLCQLAQPSV